jgi:outer membrane biosynthesis protein TonB
LRPAAQTWFAHCAADDSDDDEVNPDDAKIVWGNDEVWRVGMQAHAARQLKDANTENEQDDEAAAPAPAAPMQPPKAARKKKDPAPKQPAKDAPKKEAPAPKQPVKAAQQTTTRAPKRTAPTRATPATPKRQKTAPTTKPQSTPGASKTRPAYTSKNPTDAPLLGDENDPMGTLKTTVFKAKFNVHLTTNTGMSTVLNLAKTAANLPAPTTAACCTVATACAACGRPCSRLGASSASKCGAPSSPQGLSAC